MTALWHDDCFKICSGNYLLGYVGWKGVDACMDHVTNNFLRVQSTARLSEPLSSFLARFIRRRCMYDYFNHCKATYCVCNHCLVVCSVMKLEPPLSQEAYDVPSHTVEHSPVGLLQPLMHARCRTQRHHVSESERLGMHG